MRSLKKILALVVVFAFAVSMMASAVSYADMANAKTGDANKIGLLTELGILKGYLKADGKTYEFRPDNNITRAEFATIIYRLLTNDVANANFKAKTNFPDVTENDWFGGYVKYATALEPAVILGRTNGKFDPRANVTIAEAATMLVRALGYDKMTSLESGVAKACELGILESAAGADNAATRGQVADMTFNAMFNKYLRTGGDATLAYSVFKLTPFDAILTESKNGTVALEVIDNFNGYIFSDSWYDWFMSGASNVFVGQPHYESLTVAYPGLDAYVGYSMRIFAKDANGNKKLDIYDAVPYMYASPRNKVFEGKMSDFDSLSGSDQRIANGKFAFKGTTYGYDTTVYTSTDKTNGYAEPMAVFENGQLIATNWVKEYTTNAQGYIFGYNAATGEPNAIPAPQYENNNPAAKLQKDFTVEGYFETFMNSNAYATFKMIDNDGDGLVEYGWYVFTDNAKLGDVTSSGLVRFENIDNTLEKTVDWGRDFPKFNANYDNTISIKAVDVDFGDTAYGDYVLITPMFKGYKADNPFVPEYTYKLEKAESATGKLTAVGFGAADKIELDGKPLTMASTMYLWQYPGYAQSSTGTYYSIDGGYYANFYDLNSIVNLGKYFKVIKNKAGLVWRVEWYTPAEAIKKGHYGIVTDVTNVPVNLKANDPFATPEWVIQAKLLDENGETKVYNTNITVLWVPGTTPAVSSTDFDYLVASKGTVFINYVIDADGKLVVEVPDDPLTTEVENFTMFWDVNWSNHMASQNTVFDYSATTKYFTKEGFNSVFGDYRFKIDDYSVIFKFADKNGNGLKDADEAVTVIKASELTDLNNVTIYADDCADFSTGVKDVDAIVIMDKVASATSIHIGWWQQTQTRAIDSATGEPVAWTYTFAEATGTKSYNSTLEIPNPWASWGSTYKLYMYSVDESGNIVSFLTFQNGDFVRPASDFAEGVYFTVQLGNSAKINDTMLDLDVFVDVKNDIVDPLNPTKTIALNALLTEDSKIYILKTYSDADNPSTPDIEYDPRLGEGSGNDGYYDPVNGTLPYYKIDWTSWYKAKSSNNDLFFDFNRWTGKYAGTPYDLTAAEKKYFNPYGDYYQFGWAKFAVENGQLVITELYLFDEPIR